MRNFHGLSDTHTAYNNWVTMRNRCNNPKNRYFHKYGGRGVIVCERWDDFTKFAEDMGEKPAKGSRLVLIDKSKHFEPGNVRWSTGTKRVYTPHVEHEPMFVDSKGFFVHDPKLATI